MKIRFRFYKKQFLFCLLFITKLSYAQFGNVWCFGNGYGLDFNLSGDPISTDTLAIWAKEGCSSVCDSSGNLLFFTNGINVWNRNNEIMLNGDTIGLTMSTTQSSIIIPHPGNPNYYFIFTIGDMAMYPGHAPDSALAYSIVDISHDGGFGEVILKHQILMEPMCEKLAATRHCNGHDWWVVARKYNSNSFVSYLVTDAGVINNPQYSNVGLFPRPGVPFDFKYGQMKISPNGKWLAACSQNVGLEIYSFNTQLGIADTVVFYREIQYDTLNNYGLSFTADSKRLFVGEEKYLGGSLPETDIVYFSLSNNIDTLANSKQYISIVDSIKATRSYQLSPDKKIYISTIVAEASGIGGHYRTCRIENSTSNSPTLVILNDFIDYVPIITLGLPSFYDGIFTNHHKASLRIPLCNPALTYDSIPFYDSLLTTTRDYIWDFGDPASGANNTSTLQHPIHYFSSTGVFTVTLTLPSDCNPISVSQQVSVTQLPPPQPVISWVGQELGSTAGISYQWYFNGVLITGANSQQLFPFQPGNYSVSVTDVNGCSSMSEQFNVTVVMMSKKLKSGIQIYPNPASQQVYIQSGSPVVSVQAINMSGQCINLSYRSLGTNDVADISTLSPGLYMLRVCTQEGVEVRKLVVE